MKKLIFILLIVVLAVTGCNVKGSDLAQNREKWQAQNVSHYRFQLDIVCFCAFRDQMPLVVEVQDGEVVSIAAVNGSDISISREFFTDSDTIDELFALVETAGKEAEEMTVTYNAEFGFPETISIDYIKEAVDDEIWYTISNFEVIS